jgi:hypothetical protein
MVFSQAILAYRLFTSSRLCLNMSKNAVVEGIYKGGYRQKIAS